MVNGNFLQSTSAMNVCSKYPGLKLVKVENFLDGPQNLAVGFHKPTANSSDSEETQVSVLVAAAKLSHWLSGLLLKGDIYEMYSRHILQGGCFNGALDSEETDELAKFVVDDMVGTILLVVAAALVVTCSNVFYLAKTQRKRAKHTYDLQYAQQRLILSCAELPPALQEIVHRKGGVAADDLCGDREGAANPRWKSLLHLHKRSIAEAQLKCATVAASVDTDTASDRLTARYALRVCLNPRPVRIRIARALTIHFVFAAQGPAEGTRHDATACAR
jgi:hypothetical protein